MTEEKPEIIYPEMLEYAWVRDLDRVKGNSKYVKQDYSGEPVTADKLPKSPINLVLAVMKESLSYPEIVEAYSVEADGKRSFHLLMWFDEYLLHKYGNIPDPRKEAAWYMTEIARGVYAGLDDPKLISDLSSDQFVSSDDGVNYEQPLAD